MFGDSKTAVPTGVSLAVFIQGFVEVLGKRGRREGNGAEMKGGERIQIGNPSKRACAPQRYYILNIQENTVFAL